MVEARRADPANGNRWIDRIRWRYLAGNRAADALSFFKQQNQLGESR